MEMRPNAEQRAGLGRPDSCQPVVRFSWRGHALCQVMADPLRVPDSSPPEPGNEFLLAPICAASEVGPPPAPALFGEPLTRRIGAEIDWF